MTDLILSTIVQNPKVATVYAGLTGAYVVFCATAALTKNTKDDKVADKLRRFFSLKPKK